MWCKHSRRGPKRAGPRLWRGARGREGLDLEKAGPETSRDPEGRDRDVPRPEGRDQGLSGAARGRLVGAEPETLGGLGAEAGGGTSGRSRGARPVPPEHKPPSLNGRQGEGWEEKEGVFKFYF